MFIYKSGIKGLLYGEKSRVYLKYENIWVWVRIFKYFWMLLFGLKKRLVKIFLVIKYVGIGDICFFVYFNFKYIYWV